MATLSEFCKIVLEAMPTDIKAKESKVVKTLTEMKQTAESGKLDLEGGHKTALKGFCWMATVEEVKISLSKYQNEPWANNMMNQITQAREKMSE